MIQAKLLNSGTTSVYRMQGTAITIRPRRSIIRAATAATGHPVRVLPTLVT
jgi:hypothetical protein